ncbi:MULTISPECIES: hypothetical protein [Marinobacter]|uniref:Uncharacterized protein n=1 Tax=Marinobacter psychrophilus TaxID=330734 RepID=A0A0H4I103_9GAMM|nr:MULTISPECIES: hypothetical protein [Marinobacter]AFP30960.1 hypothetical protein MRBBS_2023 [Marinobacter sp. BSs20148]AKO52619.1 hypothetical protein ABA45_09535 [Marinobacter psychrophilus]
MKTLPHIFGIALDDERLAQIVEAYRPILGEIEKLRTLDLKATYPAVHFNPSTAYAKGETKQ